MRTRRLAARMTLVVAVTAGGLGWAQFARGQDGATLPASPAQASTPSPTPSDYAELSDKELFDKCTAEMKKGNEDAELSMARALLARYPFLQDQKRFHKLPGKTQDLLQQASMRVVMIRESQQYFAQTGVHLATIGNGVSAPQVTHQVDPEFSAEAREQRSVNETVLVNLIVNQQGVPESVHIIRAVGMGLDAQAVKAVSQYRFKPAMEKRQAGAGDAECRGQIREILESPQIAPMAVANTISIVLGCPEATANERFPDAICS